MINLKYPILEPGLYVISVPIGCLSDLTFRALNVLKSTNNILAEDTRNAKTLLQALEIDISQKKITSYHEHTPQPERKKGKLKKKGTKQQKARKTRDKKKRLRRKGQRKEKLD